jgi:hypothetical protein
MEAGRGPRGIAFLRGRSVWSRRRYCWRDAYRRRSRIEQVIGWYKECRALGTRYRKIRVNVLSPGPIETPIFNKAGLTREQIDEFKASQVAAVRWAGWARRTRSPTPPCSSPRTTATTSPASSCSSMAVWPRFEAARLPCWPVADGSARASPGQRGSLTAPSVARPHLLSRSKPTCSTDCHRPRCAAPGRHSREDELRAP